MKGIKNLSLLLLVLVIGLLAGCSKKNEGSKGTIKVCASDVPHAEVLEGVVKGILANKGYELKVTILDWTEQNASTVAGDYDANYFQHVPYLESDSSAKGLFAVCKVHYEPLGIYQGKKTVLSEGTTFEICDDNTNGVRAFDLLFNKGVLNESLEKENNNFPYVADDDETKFTFNTTSWTSSNGITVTLVPEESLVERLNDYDFGVLPCNTAFTGNVNVEKRVEIEADEVQVTDKANVLAARTEDYNNDSDYKAKIDALADALLSIETKNYFLTKYNGIIICDERTQIDLRTSE